jgi:hypothetical protein
MTSVTPEKDGMVEPSIIKTAAFDRAVRGDGIAALMAADVTAKRKLKGERDTEFIKRIGRAYLMACETLVQIDAVESVRASLNPDANMGEKR